VDRNPYKQSTYTPGTRIPIHPPERIDETRPDVIVILPWNLAREISTQGAVPEHWPSFHVLAMALAHGVLGRFSDEPFEHAEVTLVDEVLGPTISCDRHDTSTDQLDPDGLVEGDVLERLEDLYERRPPVRTRALRHEDPLPTEMLDRPVLSQALERVGRLPPGDRRIGSGEHCTDRGFDLANAGERPNTVVRDDDFDIGEEQRDRRAERLRPGDATRRDTTHRIPVPTVSGRQDDDDVATERSNQVDRSVDHAPTSERDGVLRLAEASTMPPRQNDRRDDRLGKRVRRCLLVSHRDHVTVNNPAIRSVQLLTRVPGAVALMSHRRHASRQAPTTRLRA
jgi:hypothetical protein